MLTTDTERLVSDSVGVGVGVGRKVARVVLCLGHGADEGGEGMLREPRVRGPFESGSECADVSVSILQISVFFL